MSSPERRYRITIEGTLTGKRPIAGDAIVAHVTEVTEITPPDPAPSAEFISDAELGEMERFWERQEERFWKGEVRDSRAELSRAYAALREIEMRAPPTIEAEMKRLRVYFDQGAAVKTVPWPPPPWVNDCLCSIAVRAKGHSWVRLDTSPICPLHGDDKHRFTAALPPEGH